MEVCADVLQATCYGRAARAEEQQKLGQIQVALAVHSAVSTKELYKVVILESWTGICLGRAPATHRAADNVFCT